LLLDDWARRRGGYMPALLELSGRIRTLLEAVELTGSGALSWHELRRMCEDLGEPAWPGPPAQCGLARVERPGAILGPAETVVWWNFSRETVARPDRLLVTRAERGAMQASGIEPPDPSLAIAIETAGWRRPLTQSRQGLVLACPLTDSQGETNHPHSLWDDIVASLADHGDAPKLELNRLARPAPAKLQHLQRRARLAPRTVVSLPAPIPPREIESPSSLEKLLGCSFSWTLEYHGRLRPGLSSGPAPVGPLLFGKLAHRILEQVMTQDLLIPADAADRAEALFDLEATEICEDLGLPQHQAARAVVKRAVVESTRELTRLVRTCGARVLGTEIVARAELDGRAFEGRMDLVLENPAVVLDLKWSKGAHVQALKAGTAIQLAAYAAIRRATGQPPETGYFTLQTQDLLMEPGGCLAGEAREIGSYRALEIWPSVLALYRQRLEAIASGSLEAAGATREDSQSSFTPGWLHVAPPCRYCEHATLCGRVGAR
jgi:hypothetical protein